ncbi:CPBP family intramembrane glutamic endopeptidase [Rubinisphaera italica]|uniref:CAAX amino terminal protease self-immunity n=1 Tax=Rubinisphaera italica TaxID=2527969 RepID=A0A5C5XE73_9PLAN|nr:CPBP family intramembrane glutamic endopeptidase [Rubinisphaera italica]TWT61094.1 CAAX amino terminal protease self- immunity [Rubinisphaera italica]
MLPKFIQAKLSDSPPATRRARHTLQDPQGPGMVESIFWFLGTWGLHLLGVGLTVGVFVAIFSSSGLAWNDLIVLEFLAAHQMTLLAGEQFVFVTLVLIAAWFRLRGNLGHRLSSRPLPFQHVFLLTCLVIPLSTFSTALHQWGMRGWNSLLENVPGLRAMDTMQSMDLLQELSSTTPLWTLLLVFAIAPALGEEIIFRGVIGRGLIRRWGLVGGILLTSFLFAIAHMHPVHALAVFPIGIVLHYVYITTRSFWAPLYLHFCNNTFSIMKSTHTIPSAENWNFTAALTITLCLILFLSFLWITRVRYVQHDGKEWTPPRPSLELPIEIPVTLTFSSLPWRLTVGGLVPLIGFLAATAAHAQ